MVSRCVCRLEEEDATLLSVPVPGALSQTLQHCLALCMLLVIGPGIKHKCFWKQHLNGCCSLYACF